MKICQKVMEKSWNFEFLQISLTFLLRKMSGPLLTRNDTDSPPIAVKYFVKSKNVQFFFW